MKPFILSWNVTSACNLNCAHCYLSAGRKIPAELSTEEGYRLIDEIGSLGTQMLILSGGEPLLRPDIFKLASYAADQGIIVTLGTNGTLIDREMARKIRQSGITGVGISLDSLEPAKHDAFRGLSGAFNKTIQGIRNSLEEGLRVQLEMSITPQNFAELPRMVEFAHQEGATSFCLYYLVCTGRGEKLTDISREQYKESLLFLLEAQKSFPGMMVRARCAPHIHQLAFEHSSPLIGSAGCLATSKYCRITPDGQVTPCPYLPLSGGNIREKSLAEIWQGSPLFQELRTLPLKGRCGVCELGRLCGGCRARAWASTGDLFAEDPFCGYQPTGKALLKDELIWSQEALQRLERMPDFIRDWIKLAIEHHARLNKKKEISLESLTEVLKSLGARFDASKSPN